MCVRAVCVYRVGVLLEEVLLKGLHFVLSQLVRLPPLRGRGDAEKSKHGLCTKMKDYEIIEIELASARPKV